LIRSKAVSGGPYRDRTTTNRLSTRLFGPSVLTGVHSSFV
jgi:hypothetical protein